MKINKYKIDDYIIVNRNLKEVEKIVEEKFRKQEYKIDLKTDKPFIIDAGAHIGITTLYFKKIFPQSRILAFEPDENNYELFLENMKSNNIKDVKCINAALSDNNSRTIMFTSHDDKSPWTWGNTVIKNLWGPDDVDNKEMLVQTVRLSDYIHETVDLLKIDIEGAEEMVLTEIKEKLKFVRNIIMEFHGTKFNRDTNNLNSISKLLTDNDFDVKITPVDQSHNLSQEYIKKVELEYYLVRASREK